MRTMARIHTFTGVLLAVLALAWLASGLMLTARSEAETQGDAYLRDKTARPLPPGWLAAQLIEGEDRPIEMRTRMQGNSVVTSAIYADGKVERYFAKSGEPVPEIDMAAARTIVAMDIAGGDKVASVTAFEADRAPAELGQKLPVWRVALQDGTNVYVGRETGAIEAIRTPWWRLHHKARMVHAMGGKAAMAGWLGLALLALVLLSSLVLRRTHAAAREGSA